MNRVLKSLDALGWRRFQSTQGLAADARSEVARVISQEAGLFEICAERGSMLAELPGRSFARGLTPTVGDWVRVSFPEQSGRAFIEDLYPRMSLLQRKAPGRSGTAQSLAANIDYVLLMTALTRDLNLRRIERGLATIWESGARPIILLNKCDLYDEGGPLVEALQGLGGVPVHLMSALKGIGIDELRPYFSEGQTSVLMGSSGVGKSTLTNALMACGDPLATNETRRDDRGRHTTTRRALIPLPSGGCLVDMPGMRELGLLEGEDGIVLAFPEIEEHLGGCRFRDCRHDQEPGCAVREAVQAGAVDPERLESFQALLAERERSRQRGEKRARFEERRRNRRASQPRGQARERWDGS